MILTAMVGLIWRRPSPRGRLWCRAASRHPPRLSPLTVFLPNMKQARNWKPARRSGEVS
ncbi:hypothetical protein [Mesorhizobium sp. M0618]|uniref:hypothetical protein n=1 Tax=unclassified Mesorhizobium TaxID=325217 RepID=UPI00333C5B60